MTYSSIVKDAKKAVKAIDTAKITDHVAVEIDITGEGEGAFYIELSPGSVKVEPYEYYDRDFLIRGEGAVILDVLTGKKTIDQAKDLVKWEGNLAKAAILKDVLAPVKLESKKAEQHKIESKKTEKVKIESKKKPSEKIESKKK
nr:SCP2 sterol-binding domain-containing protein [Butyrivibrio sp.]